MEAIHLLPIIENPGSNLSLTWMVQKISATMPCVCTSVLKVTQLCSGKLVGISVLTHSVSCGNFFVWLLRTLALTAFSPILDYSDQLCPHVRQPMVDIFFSGRGRLYTEIRRSAKRQHPKQACWLLYPVAGNLDEYRRPKCNVGVEAKVHFLSKDQLDQFSQIF